MIASVTTRLDVFQYALTREWSRRQLEDGAPGSIEITVVQDVEWVRAQFHALIAGRKFRGDPIVYPTTWWDAFKARWFPAWALLRWPPAYTRFVPTMTELYPDVKPLPGMRSVVICAFDREVDLTRRIES